MQTVPKDIEFVKDDSGEIVDKKVADSLADLSEDELREKKRQGKIIYTTQKSKDGTRERTCCGRVYSNSGGTLKRLVPKDGLTKKQRSKNRREAKEQRNEKDSTSV